MYMYIYKNIDTHIHIYTHRHTYILTRTYTNTFTDKHVYTCVGEKEIWWMTLSALVTYISIYVYMYVFI
jgi:hypothetical protein